MSVKEARNYASEWLLENEIKTSSGILKLEYDAYDGDKPKYEVPYIIVDEPISQNTGNLSIKIYSSQEIKAPASKGSPGMMEGIAWSYSLGKEKISPFIFTMTGKVNRIKTGYFRGEITHKYKWVKNPQITIEFPDKVPEIKITKKSFFGNIKNKIANSINKTKTAFGKVGGAVSDGLSEIGKDISNFTRKIKTTISKLFGASVGEKLPDYSDYQDKEQEYLTRISELEKHVQELEEKLEREQLEQKEEMRRQASRYQAEIKKLQEEILKKSSDINSSDTADYEFQRTFEQKEMPEKQKEPEEEPLEDQEEKQPEKQEKERSQVQTLPLLISEVCAGLDSSKNEFIEIYNPNDIPIEINNENFELKLVNSKNNTTKKKITWKRNTIPAKGFFLFVAGELIINGKKIEGDANFSSGLTSVSGVIISDADGKIFDKVGWGKPGLMPPTLAVETQCIIKDKGLYTGESLQRKSKNNFLIDTNNNYYDFEFSSLITPQNSLDQKAIYTKPASRQSGGFSSNTPSLTNSSFSQNNQENSQELPPLERILITEVQIEGEQSSDDFIELFNPNNQLVDISGWQIKKKTSSGKESSVIVVPQGTIIDPLNYILWASSKNDYHQRVGADISTAAYLSKNNSIALFDKEKRLIDAVAWGEGENQFVEDIPFSENPAKNQTIGRKINENTQEYIDTDNNSLDFEIQIPTPKGKNQKLTEENKPQTDSENNGNEGSDKNQESRNQERDENNDETAQEQPQQHLAQSLVISEISLNDPEFIEIYNPKDEPATLAGKFLAYYSSEREVNNPYRIWQFDDGLTIDPKEHFVVLVYSKDKELNFDWQLVTSKKKPYSKEQLSSNGTLGIFSSDPKQENPEVAQNYLIDLVGWGEVVLKETEAVENPSENKTLARKITVQESGYLTYQDSDNNFQDFEARDPTPKEFNNPFIDLDNDGIANRFDKETIITREIVLPVSEYTFQDLIIEPEAKLLIISDSEKDFLKD